ncbi:arabinosaccharide transport system permease protein [Evansella vedderi]|uniref:Arabinosaccharide transport system permease protein n=1 Tax=Evansella vedderi TaxID=38282 RepID=A0ABT9ZPU4_9BACI|nr:carbohydrate ABC transporter permease [Evansella vedderi]MDQ0253263.1 arabinosaccharide transport system permease protein [Evansella vedderi]
MAKQRREKWSSILLVVFLVIPAVIAVFPLAALTLASLKPSTELMRFGLNIYPQFELWSLNNYAYLFTDGSIYFRWFKNSIIISFFSTILALTFSSMVGYSLAMYRFRGQTIVLFLVLLIMMIPFEILMLPLFRMMIALGAVNTYTGVILPMIVHPLTIFFFRQFALGLPKDLMDAARIDGCTEYGIFFKIMVPLMKPAYGAMGILLALFSWNNFLWPLVVLRTTDMFTLPIGLAGLLSPYGNNYDVLIAGSVLTVLPIIIVFIFAQKYFISSLTAGAVKG